MPFYISHRGNPFHKGSAISGWWTRFKRRHPRLSLKTPIILDAGRHLVALHISTNFKIDYWLVAYTWRKYIEIFSEHGYTQYIACNPKGGRWKCPNIAHQSWQQSISELLPVSSQAWNIYWCKHTYVAIYWMQIYLISLAYI